MHKSKAEGHIQIQGTLTTMGHPPREPGTSSGQGGRALAVMAPDKMMPRKHEVVSSSVSKRILSSEGGVGSKFLISLEVPECSHKT